MKNSNGSGVLYLIDMDNRQIYISTAGTGIEQYTDNEIESTLDVLYEHVSDQDYYGSCTAFVKEAEKCLTGGESADNGYYDSERESFVDYDSSDYKKIRWQDSLAEAFRPGTLFMNLGIAAVIAGIITLIISHNRKTQTTVSSRTYLKQGSLHQNEHTDFVHAYHRCDNERSSMITITAVAEEAAVTAPAIPAAAVPATEAAEEALK